MKPLRMEDAQFSSNSEKSCLKNIPLALLNRNIHVC